MKTIKLPFVLSVIPGSVFMAVLLWNSSANEWGQRRFTLFDDAMISMDYARTFAQTGRFVWYPGAPRVQGFTNPLWTLWMTIIHQFGFEGSTASLLVSLSGILLILGTSWVAYSIVTQALGEHSIAPAVLASSSICFMYPTVYWTLRGMEVGLLAFLTLLLIRGVLHNATNPPSGFSGSILLPAALGIATRFDFIVVCMVALLAMTFWAPLHARRRTLINYGAFFIACLAIVSGLQKVYWGSWFPNTYHLKIDGVDLFDRISRGAVSGAKALVLVSLLLISVSIVKRISQPARRLVQLSAAVFLAISAYAVYIGGDAWEDQMLNRFFATGLPLIAIVVATAFGERISRLHIAVLISSVVIASVGYGATVNPFGFSRRDIELALVISVVGSILIVTASLVRVQSLQFLTSAAILITVVTAVSGIPLQRQIRNDNVLGSRVNVYVTEIVENLALTTKPDATIATVWAGVPAYYSHRTMLDLLGKNDTYIARTVPHGAFFPGHNKWDYNYSIGQLQPDVIFQTFTRGIEENLPQRIKAWGYEKRCMASQPFPTDGVYYRLNSTRINWDMLTACKK